MLKRKNKKRMKRNEDSLKDPWKNIKCTRICIVRVPEGEERQKGPENITEDIIAETSVTWKRKQASNSRKLRVTYKIKPERNTARYIVTKMEKLKIKGEYYKHQGKKTSYTQGNSHNSIS